MWDPASNAWTRVASMATARIRQTATLLQDGKVLVVGGSNSGSGQTAAAYLNSAEEYDAAGDSWTSAGQMVSARSGHTATLLPNGHVLVAGGSDGDTTLATVEDFDPGASKWSEAAPMAVARWLHTSTLLPNNQVIVLGGADGANTLNSAERYNVATASWTSSTNAAENLTGNP
jgi:N-acetylneuraminic acid mutarotase